MTENDADATPVPPTASFDEQVTIYELYRDYIKHEDSLRGQRTGWLLTVQAFLFAAVGVSLNASPGQPKPIIAAAFPLVLALIGIFVSVNHGMRYASQNRVYDSLDRAFEEMKRTHGSNRTQGLPDLRYGKSRQAEGLHILSYHKIFFSVWAIFFVVYGLYVAHTYLWHCQAACCRDHRDGRAPTPTHIRTHAIRTDFGRPSSSIRFRAFAATAASVA